MLNNHQTKGENKMYIEIKQGNRPRVLRGCRVIGVVQDKFTEEDLRRMSSESSETEYSVTDIHYSKGNNYYVQHLTAISTDWVSGDLYKMDYSTYDKHFGEHGFLDEAIGVKDTIADY